MPNPPAEPPRRAPTLRREVLVALGIKAALLTLLYLLCFGPAHEPAADAGAIASALIAPDAR